MLKVKLLNEQCTLNNFDYLEVKEYIPNYPFKIKVQMMDSETGHRLIPGSAAKLNAVFQNREGEELTIPASMLFSPDDRSMWEVSLTAEQSNDIIGGNVKFMLDFNGDSTNPDLSDSTDLRVGMGYSIIAKVTFDGEC